MKPEYDEPNLTNCSLDHGGLHDPSRIPTFWGVGDAFKRAKSLKIYITLGMD